MKRVHRSSSSPSDPSSVRPAWPFAASAPEPTGAGPTWTHFRRLMDAAPDGMVVVDRSGRIVVTNRQAERMFGYDAAEMIGQPVEMLVPDAIRDCHAAWRESYMDTVRARPHGALVDLHARRKDGGEFPAEIGLNPFHDATGDFVVASVRDTTQRAQQQDALRRSEARFRAVFDGASVGIALVGRDGRLQGMNGALASYLGYTPEEMIGQPMASYMHTADARLGAAERADLVSGQRDRCESERRYVRRDGRIAWLRSHDALVRDAGGRPDFVVSVTEDVTERRRTEQALRDRTLELLQLVGRAASEATTLEEAMTLCVAHVCDTLEWPVGHVLMRGASGDLVPGGIWRLSDARRFAALGDTTRARWSAQDAPPIRALLSGLPLWLPARHTSGASPRQRAAAEAGLVTRVCIPVLADSEIVAALEFFTSTPHEADDQLDNAMMRIGVHLGRVIERQRAQEQLEHIALHDGLTALPNRRLFLDRLHHALARLDRSERKLAVFFMDLDGLKHVNDTLGHGAGDELLTKVAARLRSQVRPGDTIARLGGDEFTLLCEEVADTAEARLIGARILQCVSQPLQIRDIQFEPSLSVGLAMVDDPQASPEAVLREADAAMYQAKDQGGGRFECAPSSAPGRRVTNRARALRDAIQDGELRLLYQPCVSLPSAHVVGVEALVRWEHPRRGLLAPRSFIPLAEQNGLIEPLGQWVIHHACRQVAAWQRDVAGAAPLNLLLNVSSRQFASGQLVRTVADALDDSGLDPRRLFLEITESVMIENTEAVLQQLQQLRALHVRVSVDDFGIGYSSLSYLHRLPLDQLKLDREFIAGLGVDPQSRAIVEAVIRLAHTLELEVVAEGVEHEHQRDELVRMGCDCAQGFLFAPPASPADIEALLRDALPLPQLRPRAPESDGPAPVPPAVAEVCEASRLRPAA